MEKYFIQKITYADGKVREIERNYEEMLNFKNRIEAGEITGIKNLVKHSTFDWSFDRGELHYDFYLDEAKLGIVGISNK